MTRLSHPAPGRPLTSPFGPRRHPITGKETLHRGDDFGGSFNVLAAADGVVVVNGFDAGGFGHYVIVEHDVAGLLLRTLYAHGAHRSKHEVGDRVLAGAVIFRSGSTGLSTGNHLHFEVHERDQFGRWRAVNPAPYLRPAGQPTGRRKTSVTLYYCTTTDKPSSSSSPQPIQEYALAGESPGTSANWLETQDPSVATAWAVAHGSAVFLTRDSFAAFRARYLEPLRIAGSTVGDDSAVLAAVTAVPGKTVDELKARL